MARAMDLAPTARPLLREEIGKRTEGAPDASIRP
jgi:hypothetical protein